MHTSALFAGVYSVAHFGLKGMLESLTNICLLQGKKSAKNKYPYLRAVTPPFASHTNTNAVASNICCSADNIDADDDTKPPTRESAAAADWASDAASDKGCGADEDDDEEEDELNSGDDEEDEEEEEEDDENGLFLKIDMKPEFLRRS